MKEKLWIIGIGGSDMDGVGIQTVRGTKEQIKEFLCKLIEMDTINNTCDIWDCGTENPEEVIERSETELYAYVCYMNSHIDYTAVSVSDAAEKVEYIFTPI